MSGKVAMVMRAGRGMNAVTLETTLQLYDTSFCAVRGIWAIENGTCLLMQSLFSLAL